MPTTTKLRKETVGPWPGCLSLVSARGRPPRCIWAAGAATAMRCCLSLLAVVWGVVFLVEVWFPSRGQRGRAHARKHACARGSFKVAVLFVWLLGTRIWADIPTSVLGSLRFVSKHELRRRIRSTWVCRSSLFYLSHTRNCAITPARSIKSGGKPGLSCCC